MLLSSFAVVFDKGQPLVYTFTLSFIPDRCYVISPNTYVTYTIIPSQRLVTMSVSLHTQNVLRCLIIQVLNIKSLFPKCLIQSLSLLYTVI